MRSIKLSTVIVAVALLCIVTATFTIKQEQQYLGLYDGKTAELITGYPLEGDGEFHIAFKHSVNKTVVNEGYTVKDGEIYLQSCKYFGLGAGVASQIEGDQKLTFLEDGSMLITGFNRKIENLSYIVGTVYDHMLYINDSEINLRELCGQNRMVVFRTFDK